MSARSGDRSRTRAERAEDAYATTKQRLEMGRGVPLTESALVIATSALTKAYGVKALRPFAPRTLGYRAEFKFEQQGKLHARRSREWFFVWMGLLSFLIAKGHLQQYPTWQDVLRSANFAHSWIDAVQNSAVCDFSGRTERMGVFLTATCTDGHSQWLKDMHIPLWFLNRHAPVHLPLPMDPAPEPLLKRYERSAANRIATVHEFIASRCARNEQAMKTETENQRLARESRTRNPPTVSAKVFVWEEDYNDPLKLVRVSVTKVAREVTLTSFSADEKIYDPFYNEWDCCEDLGDDPNNDNEEEWGAMMHHPAHATGLNTAVDTTSSDFALAAANLNYAVGGAGLDTAVDTIPLDELPPPHPRALTPPPTSALISDGQPLRHLHIAPVTANNLDQMCDAWQEETLEVLQTVYGYLAPLPFPGYLSPVTVNDAKRLLRNIGDSFTDVEAFYPHRPVTRLAHEYTMSITSPSACVPPQMDIHPDSRMPLRSMQRVRNVRFVYTGSLEEDRLYMFDFGSDAQVPWHLTLSSATHAALVCRLNASMTDVELALYLLHRGMPFRTLQSAKNTRHAKSRATPPRVIPSRPAGHIFGREDYDAYVAQRDALLGQPRARAALMRGGFLWRLGNHCRSFDDVLKGPTGWSEHVETVFTAKDTTSGELFVDDNLTDVEADLICSVYMCASGEGLFSAIACFASLTRTLQHPVASLRYVHGTPYAPRTNPRVRTMGAGARIVRTASTRGRRKLTILR